MISVPDRLTAFRVSAEEFWRMRISRKNYLLSKLDEARSEDLRRIKAEADAMRGRR